tara:strand:+ start:1213 stop:1467 length:255 start_codon:yes stop_codon:yes gene_type:complete
MERLSGRAVPNRIEVIDEFWISKVERARGSDEEDNPYYVLLPEMLSEERALILQVLKLYTPLADVLPAKNTQERRVWSAHLFKL